MLTLDLGKGAAWASYSYRSDSEELSGILSIVAASDS